MWHFGVNGTAVSSLDRLDAQFYFSVVQSRKHIILSHLMPLYVNCNFEENSDNLPCWFAGYQDKCHLSKSKEYQEVLLLCPVMFSHTFKSRIFE